MKWLNIEISTLRSAAYVGSEPSERATWLNLVAYCADQENGGVIVGAKSWKDRQWQQTCGVTLEEVISATNLLTWVGDDLAVWNYPMRQEEIQRAKREGGRDGGIKSGHSRAQQSERRSPSSTPSPDGGSSPSTEGKGKGKEKKEEQERNCAPGSAPSDAELIYEAYPRKQGRQDALKAIAKALTAKPAEFLLAQTRAYANATASWPHEDRQYIPHPARWFNRGSYDDDPATWQRTSARAAEPPRVDDDTLKHIHATNRVRFAQLIAYPRIQAQAQRLNLVSAPKLSDEETIALASINPQRLGQLVQDHESIRRQVQRLKDAGQLELN